MTKLWIMDCKLNHGLLFEVIIYQTRRNIQKLSIYHLTIYQDKRFHSLFHISVFQFFPFSYQFETAFLKQLLNFFLEKIHGNVFFVAISPKILIFACISARYFSEIRCILSNSDHLCSSQVLERGRSLTV